MKIFYNKQKPKIFQSRKNKDFSNEALMHELERFIEIFSNFIWGI